jgi:hypothetical protein
MHWGINTLILVIATLSGSATGGHPPEQHACTVPPMLKAAHAADDALARAAGTSTEATTLTNAPPVEGALLKISENCVQYQDKYKTLQVTWSPVRARQTPRQSAMCLSGQAHRSIKLLGRESYACLENHSPAPTIPVAATALVSICRHTNAYQKVY